MSLPGISNSVCVVDSLSRLQFEDAPKPWQIRLLLASFSSNTIFNITIASQISNHSHVCTSLKVGFYGAKTSGAKRTVSSQRMGKCLLVQF